MIDQPVHLDDHLQGIGGLGKPVLDFAFTCSEGKSVELHNVAARPLKKCYMKKDCIETMHYLPPRRSRSPPPRRSPAPPLPPLPKVRMARSMSLAFDSKTSIYLGRTNINNLKCSKSRGIPGSKMFPVHVKSSLHLLSRFQFNPGLTQFSGAFLRPATRPASSSSS